MHSGQGIFWMEENPAGSSMTKDLGFFGISVTESFPAGGVVSKSITIVLDLAFPVPTAEKTANSIKTL